MTERVDRGPNPDALVAAPFLATAMVCAAFAFVGLGVSSYWIDELFSLFVIDHHGGLREVLHRALTDTHPPAYYVIAYEWRQLFGSSEVAMRSLSALASVATLPVLFFGLRRTFSLPARSFAVALAAGSRLFFEQSQNVRSYAFCALLGAILLVLTLAIHRRSSKGEAVFPGLTLALWGFGLLASFTHFYAFLAVGAVHLFLLLGARRWSFRAAILVSGGTIFGLVCSYARALLHDSQQNLHNMWFSNRPGFLVYELLGGIASCWSDLAIGAVVLLVLAPRLNGAWAGRFAQVQDRERRTALALSGLVIVMTVVVGLIVSIVLAPSFGKRNLIVLGPFFWVIAAWLYDAIRPDPRTRPGLILILLLIGLTAGNALAVEGRFLPRNEEWRASADYVAQSPGCEGQAIPVVLPFIFGPSTPFFRQLAERNFFGRYATQPERLHAFTPAEFAPGSGVASLATLLRQRAVTPGCQVLAWGVHDLNEARVADLRSKIAATAGLPLARVVVRNFDRSKLGLLGSTQRRHSAYVFEVRPAAG